MNIAGDPITGKYNFVRYKFTTATTINTFNSSLCSIQTPSSSQSTLLEYRPGAPILPFTQFAPGSGYIIRAKEDFTITQSGQTLPSFSAINVFGDSTTGKYNIINYPFISATNVNAFNSSLCAVQTSSPTQQTIVEYRPGAPIVPFTQFVPGSGYLIRAKQNFNITGTLPSQETIVAQDFASNYEVSYPTGSNAGIGFSPWTIASVNNGGIFLGSSVASGMGNVNDNAGLYSLRAFGAYAHPTDTQNNVDILRPFTQSLQTNQRFSLEIAVSFRNGNKGIDLCSDYAGQNPFWNFNVGLDTYGVNEDNLLWPFFEQTVIDLLVTRLPTNQLEVKITRRNDQLSNTVIIAEELRSFKLYVDRTENSDPGSGGDSRNNLFFNRPKVFFLSQ